MYFESEQMCPDLIGEQQLKHTQSGAAAEVSKAAVCVYILYIPGSRSYSYLVTTWAVSVCIHQLVLKPHSKVSLCGGLASGLFQLMHISCEDHGVTQATVARRKTKKKKYHSVHNCHKGEFQHIVSAMHHSNHGSVVRIFVGFPESYNTNESWSELLSNGNRQEDKSTRTSSTKVSFSAKIIRFSQHTKAMTMV